MAKQTFRIGCMECGTIQTEAIDLDSDVDVAGLGIIVAELLNNGHVVIAVDNHHTAGRAYTGLAEVSRQQQ